MITKHIDHDRQKQVKGHGQDKLIGFNNLKKKIFFFLHNSLSQQQQKNAEAEQVLCVCVCVCDPDNHRR